MLGRQLAITFVKKNKKDETDETAVDTTSLREIGDTLVETTAGIGTVIVVVASTLTILRMTEHVVKHVFR